MKIERINDNQIRCTLTSFDLSIRDLNLGELAYGSEKAKKLFREMIQKAAGEVGFDAEDIPLMVEAIPLSNESIMLVITKIEDPEELDTRFSKFSPASEEDENSISSFTNEILEGADGLLELFSGAKNPHSPAITPDAETPAPKKQEDAKNSAPSMRVFTFGSLEEICRTARIAGQVYAGPNSLYKNTVTNRYYLVLKEQADSADSFKRICNLLLEFGTHVKADSASESYYEEHYDAIVREHALQTLSVL